MRIARHTVATIAYRLTDDAGTLLDSSEDGEPLAYIHGTDAIIPGLEQRLEGRQAGDRFQVRVPPEEAYGPRDEDMVQSVSRADLPDDVDVELGMQFQAESDEGELVLTVVGIEGDDVHMDGNHPLAGIPLTFEITVVGVRAATPEELAHGHVHGAGGGHEHESGAAPGC